MKKIFQVDELFSFGNTMENVKKYIDIKLVTTEKRRKYLVPEPIYHTTNVFSENVLAIEMKKKRKRKQILMNKPFYLSYQ